MPLFRTYAAYLRERYGARAVRICVDAGLGCPHRRSPRGGCIFCRGSGSVDAPPVTRQIDDELMRLRDAGPLPELLLYFQAGCSTNAPVKRLRELYDAALGRASFRELILATRPDCIDEERAELIASYLRPDRDVWVELGLQSALDRTLRAVGRGHDVAAFRRAFIMLRSRGIKVAAHLIFGLPGESMADLRRSMGILAALEPQGVKIHNLHVCRGTPLGELFLRGEVTAPSTASHLRAVREALELLPPKTLVMRLTTDTPRAELLAPARFADKAAFRRLLEESMLRAGTRQGRLYPGSPPGRAPR